MGARKPLNPSYAFRRLAAYPHVSSWLAGSVAAAIVAVSANPAPVLAFAAIAEPGPLRARLTDGVLIDHPLALSMELPPGSLVGVIATSYSSEVDQTDADPFTTASGARVREGIVAANFLPIGTRIVVDNTLYTVDDRMNARYNDKYRIDIWTESTNDAWQFGTRPKIVEIVSLP